MVEANIVAPGSMAGVISGHMYNRAMRAHKLLFEALSRLQLTLFLDSLDEPTKESYHYTIQKVLPDFNDNKVLAVDQLSELQLHFDRYVEQQCEASPTYRFWKSYQDMVLILLAFTRATRTSNWKRHLASLRQMLPWMFAYDRTNYARYFSAIVFSFVYNQNFQLIVTVQLIKDVCIYFICIEILAKQLFSLCVILDMLQLIGWKCSNCQAHILGSTTNWLIMLGVGPHNIKASLDLARWQQTKLLSDYQRQ